ncbi:MAG: SGNH/GDSL hydrolase family protein [Chlorobi bacterium]|nr:SGNH/GDSL hydrolase family protein [Chlorobiota bacterium]
MTRIKGQIIYLAYLVVSIIIIFALIELTVRLAFPQIKLSGTSQNLIVDSLYGNTPGIAVNEEGTSNGTIKYTNKYNAWKYSTKLSTKRKIRLILGDSVTMGIGIDNDSTFIGILMNKVDSLNFINLSLIGYSSEDYYQVLKYFRNIHKDINLSSVTVFWTLNDLYSNYPGNISPEINTNSFTYSLIDFLRKHSKTYHLIKSLFFDRAQDYFLYDSKFYNHNYSLLNESVKKLNMVSDICDSLNISFQLFLLPYEFQIRNFNVSAIFTPQNKLKSQLKNNIENIRIIDCRDAFIKYSNSSRELYLYGDGIHLSKRGHKVMASFLRKQNF